MEPTMISLAGMGLAGVVWAVRQEGRINALNQARLDDVKKADERHNDLKGDLHRLDQKIDDLFKVIAQHGRANR